MPIIITIMKMKRGEKVKRVGEKGGKEEREEERVLTICFSLSL